ncbi:MAG: alpha-2-macroglobulin family protein, partial [Myxococcota bacterium]
AYRPHGRADYKFGPAPFESGEQNSIDLGKATETIGDDDTALVACPETKITGAVGGEIIGNVSVMEAGSGRTTDEQATTWLHPEHFYIGLKSSTEKVEANETIEVIGLIVGPDGEVYRDVDEVELEFVNLQRYRTWYYDRARHHHRRRSNWQPIIDSTRTVEVDDGRFRTEVTPNALRDGFAIRARAGDAVSTLQLETERKNYRSWWWSRRNDRTPRPEDPTQIQIDGPDEVRVGERETIRFDAPFSGRALVTLETHRVVDYAWKDVKAGANEWSFAISDRVPNVYATVFLMKDPHDGEDGAFMPERAFGVQSLRVDRSPYRQQLEVEAPREVRPSSRLEVVVDAGRQESPTYVTVAAVDEGVLQLTDYETPDPLDSLIARRALGVDTFDTVGWNVHMPAGGQNGHPGGGGGGGSRDNASGRIMPVEPVALWSGIVKLPESGRKTIAFDVPQYRGELRVMAVGVGAEKVGVAETSVKVRDPLALQTTTPRFLTHRDTVEIPVFVTNTTGQEQSVEVSIDAEAIELPGSTALSSFIDPVSFAAKKKSGTVPDGESRTFVFKAETVAQSGGAKFSITAKGEGYTSTDTKQLPVHPAEPRQRLVSTVKVKDGKTKLDKHLRGWVEHSERSTFWVSDVPYADSFDHLKALIRYPHGCVEQTSSSTRPMVFLSELMQTVDPESAHSKSEIDRRVRAGLDRILSMQTSKGGFAYWPGGNRPNVWGTTTATHLLLDAKKAGYSVPQERLDDALDWLADSVRGNRYRWGRGYTHYVLAQTDRANRGAILREIGRYEDDARGRKAEQLYLLKAALYLAGDRRYEDDLRSPDMSLDSGNWYAWRSYYSDFRRKAFALNVYVDVFGHGEEGAELSRTVARRLSESSLGELNTQEMTWGITGLGKWIKQSGNSIEKAELAAGGEKVPVAADNSYGVSWSLARAADYEEVELDLKTSKGKSTYLVVSSYGVREEPTVEYGGDGLSLEREYVDANGEPLDNGEVELGDMAFVRLTMTNQTSSALQNIALVDRIPAGWEIENPRHSDKQSMSALYNRERWQQDYLEVRDDRMKVFGTVPSGHTVQVVYAVRATLAGEFTAPSVHAESMYNSEIWARERAEKVEVTSAWGDLVD